MARKPKSSKRQAANKEAYDKILIVTEGKKTEPYYFDEIKNTYKISSLNITINGDSRSAPGFVLKLAKELEKKEAKQGSPFDKVYVVIDRDDHTCFDKTIEEISRMKGGQFIAVPSIPCFEYWLLLHLKHTARCYESIVGNTAANQVLSELKAFPLMADYEKGCTGVFGKLFNNLEVAKKRAAKINQQTREIGEECPTTEMHELVNYLQNIFC